MDGPVGDSWREIRQWLAANIPSVLEALGPPATEEIARVEAAIGRALPADLRESLAVVNGVDTTRSGFGSLLPTLFNPLSCDGMIRVLGVWHSVYGREPNDGDTDPAGAPTMEWLAAFLPIADSAMGLSLFVDLRDGDRHGCVCEFDPENGGYMTAPWWGSVSEMLADVARSMTHGTPALTAYSEGGRFPGDRLSPVVPVVDEPGWMS